MEDISRDYTAQNVQELGLKDKTEQELLEGILDSGEQWTDEERRMVLASYDLARNLHQDDTHKDLPYTYHLLRNASRLTGYLHITDPEIVAATILHDAVEDHPGEIMKVSFFGSSEAPSGMPVPNDPAQQQQLALKHLSVLFSPRVAAMVAGVTNPPSSETEGLSYDEWLQSYADKVRSSTMVSEVLMIKFVDWVDNGLGILHGADLLTPEKLAHFKRKYGKLIPIFEERFSQPEIQSLLDPDAQRYVRQQLALAHRYLAA